MASKATRKLFEQALMHYAPALPILILDGQSRDAITTADAVLVASGTATLETLLLKRPMVVAYRMAWLTYAIARRMLRTPYYSLPNLLAGRRVVDEISQNDVTPEKLGRALLKFLDEPDAARAVCTTFSDIHHSLRQDASTQAASAIIELVARQQTHALR
jgi:lipid-A-disaccharide synthase